MKVSREKTFDSSFQLIIFSNSNILSLSLYNVADLKLTLDKY